jgi:hypothetical protein
MDLGEVKVAKYSKCNVVNNEGVSSDIDITKYLCADCFNTSGKKI